jgi:flagellar hook-associated protein FlgK
MTSLFDVGKSAIQAYRQSLAVTGQNIANMNTEGYMRREADLQEVTASQGGITSLANQAGLGVRVADISRSFDAFLLARARSSTSGYERMDNYLNQIMELENMLLPSDADLGSQIGRFFNALSEVASSPGDLAPRVVAIEEGDALASRFNSLSGQLSQQESGTLSMLDDAVTGISLLAKELASVNSRILSSGQSGQSPNSLLDLRDRIIGDIAKLTDVSVKYDDRGYADITLGSSGAGPSLVSMTTSTSVGYVLREDTIQIVLNPGLRNTPTSQVSSGMIAGLVDAFSMTKEVAKEVNHLASLVSTNVNKQHKLGVDLDGKTGAPMFSTSGLEIALNRSNSSSLIIEVNVNDVNSLPQKPMTAVFNAVANQWTLTGDDLEEPLTGKEQINGPGFNLAVTGEAKDGDSFYVNPQKNAAAGLTFLLKRPQEIAAASATSVSADNKNTGEASLTIKAGQTAETFVEKEVANTLANSQAPVEATNFLRDGLVATVPAGTSNIELSSFAKQAAASFQISATDIENLTQLRFELDGSDNDGPHSFNITHAAAYPNAPSGQKWSEMSEISALLNNGVLRSSGGFSLADLGLYASGGAGSFVIASSKGNFQKTGSEVAHVVTQSGTISASLSDAVDASNIQVFTREGRHLAGSALTTMQIDDLVKTKNGFSVEAVYRGDYLNKNENGYRGANIDIFSDGGHFVVATGSNGMAAAAIGGTDIVPSNALVDRNLTITMANGETRQTSISAGAWASDVANKINTDLADIGVRATAQLRVELSAFQTSGQVQFDITSLNEEPITIAASVTPSTLDSLAVAINRESDNTGVSAVVSTNGKRIILESKGGADIVLNNVIAGAPLFSSKVLKSDGSAATTSAGTNRVVTLADHGTPAFEAAMNANAAVGDKYVIDVAGTDIEYTLIASDVTSLQAAADTAARVSYLAGKLDIDANTAASGSDIGYGVTSSGTSFIVTANAVGADATVIGPMRLHPNGGAEADLGAAVSSVDGSATDLTVTFSGTGAGGAVAVTASLNDTTGFAAGTFTADASVGVGTSTISKSSAPEGDISITIDKLSGDADTANTLNKIVADNAGGTYTLSGTDSALFAIDATTGTVTATLDNETKTDSGTNGVYDFEVNYFKGGVKLVTETVELTVTDRVADNNNTQVSAFAQPKLGTSLTNVASGIIEAEDFTIYGNVGTKVIDVNGGSSARDIVSAVNSVQGDTGVYAEAQTRVNMSFPDQSAATSDSVTFKLYGKNTLPQVISGTVDFGITDGRDADLRNLADAVNAASGSTGITAKTSADGSTVTMISNDGYDIVLEGYELTSASISANVYPADETFANIGTASVLTEGAANNNSMRVGGVLKFHSPYVFSVATAADGSQGGSLFQQTPGAATLSAVSDLDVLTVENAQKMLTAVDGALVRIDLERSDLGATMSRMEYTISNLSNVALNTKGARSRIQDSDIAAETVELNRAQVLSQAAQAMLAQANRTSQSILSLLQS